MPRITTPATCSTRRACARSRAGLLQATFQASKCARFAESEICCGSAGIYNLLEPDAATQLRDRKVRNILKTDAEVIVSGNPGCLLQIATGLEAAGRPMRVMHLVEVLDQSIRWGAADELRNVPRSSLPRS